MCGICGCGTTDQKTTDQSRHQQSQDHSHHGHAEEEARLISVEQDLLAKNNRYAAANRRWFSERGILALNLVASPGAGKTTLLTRTITEMAEGTPVSVIEGDQQTNLDADRIRATGANAVQINTGKVCHLDGHMIGHALDDLKPESESVLFIENVGNLVCPAAFDLGESFRVVVLSVPEGADKPLKYPDMFHGADLMLINKSDLLPYVDFDIEQCREYALQVNPGIRIITVSATTGEGFDSWINWLKAALTMAGTGFRSNKTTANTAANV